MENTNFSEKDENEQLPPFDGAFQVMPGQPGQTPAQVPVETLPDNPLPVEAVSHNPFKSKVTLIILGILILAILGAAAYFLIGSNGSEEDDEQEPATIQNVNQSKLPSSFLSQYFNLQACSDKTLCGDDADPDQDGLTNYEEFQSKTDPQQKDTDQDGLADGDEVHVYLINPTKSHSECEQGGSGPACSYDDGSQISNDYDPMTPGIKMTASRLQSISDAIANFQLHEPTITTRSLKRIAK